jgi:hypothetical protein
MTKEEFLEDPVAGFWMTGGDVPLEWIPEAWANPRFRDNVLEEVIRSVSKVGDFGHARFWLDFLPTFLPAEDVVWLYTRVRDASGRPEDEWRAEFEEAFPRFVSLLPAARDGPPSGPPRRMPPG